MGGAAKREYQETVEAAQKEVDKTALEAKKAAAAAQLSAAKAKSVQGAHEKIVSELKQKVNAAAEHAKEYAEVLHEQAATTTDKQQALAGKYIERLEKYQEDATQCETML